MTTDTLDRLLDALACYGAGDRDGAGAQCRAVLAQGPHPVALHVLGVIALERRQPAEALALLRQAAALRPRDSDTRLALANALSANGEHAAAIENYRSVLADQPGHPGALTNLSQSLRARDETPAALDAAHAAVLAWPGSAKALTALALALLQSNQPGPALDAADDATGLDPTLVDAWVARGTARSALRFTDAAIADLEHALTLDPDHAPAHLNLGNAHLDRDDLADAERHMRDALTLDPSLAEAHASLGFLLACHGALPQAVAACEAAIALRPKLGQAHWNRSFAQLLGGDFHHGWVGYEWRKQQFPQHFPALSGREWQGEPLAGRHLLVRAEQGLGDTIQFARFLPPLVAAAAKVTLACAAPLVPLLRQLPIGLVVRDGPMPAHDLWVDQMSLPRLLGVELASIPGAGGYLTAPSAPDVEHPRGVGIAWAGNPGHSNDRRRSLPAAALASLAAVPGIPWVSLQTGSRGGEAETVLAVAGDTAAFPDFAATAALVAKLELVVTVDTAVAHLSGAMGKPVWIMLPYAPDWRWMHARADSPWYDSARLFRQPAPGDWDSVTREVSAALSAWLNREG